MSSDLKTPSEATAESESNRPLATQRDSARRSLLRANTAVAVLIASTLVLALSALWQSDRANELQSSAEASQRRAETAENLARKELWRSLLTQAHATRSSQSHEARESALEAIRRAATILPAPELRNEAIATLALPEYRVDSIIPLDASVRAYEIDDELNWAAIGRTNGDVLIYRLPEAQEWRHLRLSDGPIPAEQGSVAALSFSPKGDSLAVRYNRGALAVWDIESGRMRFAHDADQARRPASRGSFSSDGKVLVAPVFSPDGFAALNAQTGEILAHFPEFSSFHHCAVRPGTSQFAVFSDGKVSVVDWANHKTVVEYPFPDGARTLAWSADGVQLAIAGSPLQIHVWDVSKGQLLKLSGPQDPVNDLRFDPSGKHLSAVATDNATHLWDLPEGRPVSTLKGRRCIRLGPSGVTGWAVPRKQLEIHRPVRNETFVRLTGVPGEAEEATMDISPDGHWAVSRAHPQGLHVWNLARPGPPEFLDAQSIQSLSFHPTEPKLLLMRNRHLEVLDVSPWIKNGDRPSLSDNPTSLPAVPNQPLDLVTSSVDGTTRAYVLLEGGAVWAEHFGEDIPVVQMQDILHSSVDHRSGSPRGTGTIALSPDGRWMAISADGRKGTCLYNTRSGRLQKVLDSRLGGVQFSPDGRWLVLATYSYCRLFRTDTWEMAWSKPGDTQSPSYSGAAAFSPDGDRIAVVGSSTRASLLVTETGRELGELESPLPSPIRVARWSKDGRRLVFWTRENSLDVWNPEALQRQLAQLGLDWNSPSDPSTTSTLVASAQPKQTRNWTTTILMSATGLAGFVALRFLGRHRQLIAEFSKAEGLALRRQEELKMERELSELKSRFVSMVSHEFRTPLGITMSAVELLRNHLDQLNTAKRQELFEDIFSSTQHMASLMEQVLVLGRVEAGKLAFRPTSLNLFALCEKLVDESLSATNRRCPIQLTFDDTSAVTSTDESLLRHILTNLLSNAVKYSPPGAPVELTGRHEGPNAVLTIRDHGIGIPQADLPKLFEAFHRATNVGDIQGTGLGLVIVKRCVDLHGGTIEVTSNVGEGTSFIVRLPVAIS